VRERTHAAYLGRGDRRRAGFLALLLGQDHFAKGKASQANGWIRRAEQSLAAEQDSIEYGHLLRARGLLAKNPDEGLAHARAAYELATLSFAKTSSDRSAPFQGLMPQPRAALETERPSLPDWWSEHRRQEKASPLESRIPPSERTTCYCT
jgi:hypothetical protein